MATPVLETVSNESRACAGFPPDTYDRYVLGLLAATERTSMERELAEQCPVCLAGVQRSLNLWLVFAGSLEQVEPAADFRGRLIRIAELSNRVLTVPIRHKRKPVILVSSLVVISLVIAILLLFTFLAGRQTSRLEIETLSTKLANLQSESVVNQVKLQEESERNERIQAKLNHPNAASESSSQLQNELRKAQAEIQGLSDSIARDGERRIQNIRLLTALEHPSVKLLNFRTAEGAPSSAYAFVVDATVLFVASKMPPIPEQRQYQLWLIRKTDHQAVSLGVFSVAPGEPQLLTFDPDKDSMADMIGLAVTDEPLQGSPSPTGSKLLETPDSD